MWRRRLPRLAATVALDVVHDLGEGPVWDPVRERVVWVDIRVGRVLVGRLAGGHVEVVDRIDVGGSVGAAVPAQDGSILVAARDRLVVVGPDGSRTDGPQVVAPGSLHRLNDGSCDPQGRFVVGTCTPDDEPSTSEALVRLEADGTLTTLDDDLTLSNGLAWSADGSRLFSVDTMRRTVYVRDYGPTEVGQRAVHLRFDDDLPDGLTCDADDHLWIAFWGRGVVRRFDPTGVPVAEVVVPAPNVTSVAFAGADLRTMVVTTATKGMTPRERRRRPESGMLFTTRVDVPGQPAPLWRTTCT